MCLDCGSFLRRILASQPSMPGMRRSIRTISGLSFRASSIASSPSLASVTTKPRNARYSATISRPSMKSSTTRTEGFLTIMRHHGALRITVTAPVQLQYPLSRPDCVGIADVRRSECSFHNNRRPGSALFFVVLLTVLFVGDDLVAVRADLPLAGIARRRLTTLVSVEREG